MKKIEIKFTITLDGKKVPEKIDWSSSDIQEQTTANAIMIALWDADAVNTHWDKLSDGGKIMILLTK